MMRLTVGALAAGVAVLSLTGCGSDPTTSAEQVVAAMNARPLVRTINGTVPPGRPTLVARSDDVLSVERVGDTRDDVHVFRNVRLPGTRSPIHLHPFGGWTCVVSGQGTLFLEGAKPVTVRAGECVDMPPGRAMSNSNQGTTPAVLMDNFVAPAGSPTWRIIEKGYENLGDQFGTAGHTTTGHP